MQGSSAEPGLPNIDAKKEALRLHFGGLGRECPQILEAMDSCTELYFDPVSQIRMKSNALLDHLELPDY